MRKIGNPLARMSDRAKTPKAGASRRVAAKEKS
jgi:hypothetical protein